MCRKVRRFFGGKIGAEASKMSFVPKDKEILMSKIGKKAKGMLFAPKGATLKCDIEEKPPQSMTFLLHEKC